MIGRFIVLWHTIQNIQSMIMWVMLPRIFVPSMTSMGCLTLKLEMFQYLVNLTMTNCNGKHFQNKT